MNPVKVGINGFGRIGRLTFEGLLQKKSLDVVAFNDITDPPTLAHLLKYDSNYGRFSGAVEVAENGLKINGRVVRVLAERDPAKLPWRDLGVEYVIESTGLFTTRDKAAAHLAAGARKVVISAPADDVDATLVMGVNHTSYDPKKHSIVSNASCTTNCLAPVAKALHDAFGVQSGFMTTIHAYTNDQRILDLPHKDLRRARAAAVSLIPTSTGAAKAIGLVIPELSGKLNGLAIRVPTPTVSLVDLVVNLEKPATVKTVNAALKARAEGDLQGILGYTEEPLVSIDFKKDPHSAVVDALSTMAIADRVVKVIAWYDNEWGYSMRIGDCLDYMIQRDGST
ncbi:MAG: type I glyceraldehyde-3-phosphate dehydrogenase [bacterium]